VKLDRFIAASFGEMWADVAARFTFLALCYMLWPVLAWMAAGELVRWLRAPSDPSDFGV
jgi:hypothetical protein